MFRTETERLYFEADYQNFENISLKRRDSNAKPRNHSKWSKESILNSKIVIFTNHDFNYLCLDCDKGISKLNPVITDFLNQYNIVYFITSGTWTEGKPKDSATLCIKYKNYNPEFRKKLNKLFIVVSRLSNGEMSCDPLAIGDQMKSVFTNQMESRYYNRDGNVFDLEKLTEIAYSHFSKEWNEVERLANQYYSEAYYQKYKAMIQKPFDDIDFNKLVKYYQNMKKHNYDNWLFDTQIIDDDFLLIMGKYKSLPIETKLKTVSKKTLIRDYILIKWCKYDGYKEDLKYFADLLKSRFKITSKKQIYYIANKVLGIQPFNTSDKYMDFVSIIADEHLIAIRNKLHECRTKSRNRYLPTKKHKTHKNKGKITYYVIEKKGVTRTVKSKDKTSYLNKGWSVVEQNKLS